MFDLTTILTLIAILIATYFAVSAFNHRNAPPFPILPLPFVGSLLYLGENPRPKFEKWAKKYGDMFSLYMGKSLVVVLNTHEVIKDAVVNSEDVFSERSHLYMDEVTGNVDNGPIKGVALSNGQNWHSQRAVSMSILKSMGAGKNAIAGKIVEEGALYTHELSILWDDVMDIKPFTQMAVANIICSIVRGKRHEYDDVDFLEMIENIEYISGSVRTLNPLNFDNPSLLHLPGDRFHSKELTRRYNSVIEFIKRRYIEEKDFTKPGGDPVNSFIDAYREERMKRTNPNSKNDLDENNLVRIVFDLLLGGIDNTCTTILWFVLYMIHFPAYQRKIIREIDSVIGKNRPPSMDDEAKLPYLNATIMEVQRITSVIPLSAPRVASREVNFRGYIIPKGTKIVPNLDSVLFDPKIWGTDVHSFRPDRHLDDEGNLVVREEFTPFSMGRRSCLGADLVKMELFLLLATMLQTFRLDTGEARTEPTLEEKYGSTVAPHEYQVKLIKRKD